MNKKSKIFSGSRSNRPTVLLGLYHTLYPVVKGIIESAEDYGWNLLNLTFSDGAIPPYVKAQGAIVTCLPNDPEIDKIKENGCKTVRIGRLPHPEDHLMPVVLPDYVESGKIAASHLYGRGFRDLGFIGYKNNQLSREIWKGFKARAKELECSISHLELSHKQKFNEGRQQQEWTEMRNWISHQPKPFGVCVYSDQRAGNFCGTCLDSGLKVPEDVAIIGYRNDLQFCKTALVPITSIDPDMERMGREAVKLLHQIMNGDEIPQKPIMIPPKGIVQRNSTDVLAVPNAKVAQALRYIWEHLSEPLGANQVAGKVGLSRSGLDRMFRRHLKRSVNAEIMRKRLEICKELLRNTDFSVTHIAQITGFNNRTYLHRVFKRNFGVSPRKFRLKNN